MPIVDALLPEFDHEMTVTRKLLERVPERQVRLEAAPEVVVARRSWRSTSRPCRCGAR